MRSHSFSLRQLQYALAVEDTLSFRSAAEHCHVSQPSLSAQLAALEDALGVRLFERDRRRVMVTVAGVPLLGRARKLVLAADELTEAARRGREPLSGPLRVGVIPTISPYLLPSLTPALRGRFPGLSLRWVEDKTPVLMQRLHQGSLDAAVLALEADIGEVEHTLIGKDPFVLVAPRGHPLARAKPADRRELKGQSVLLLEDGHCFRDQALSFCTQARAEELEFRATSLPTLIQMVAGGAGITLLPALAVATEARRGRLIVRRFKAPEPSRTIVLVWRPSSALGGDFAVLGAAMRGAYPVGHAAMSPRPKRGHRSLGGSS